MLKGIDPRLPPEVLYALASMGHGDMVVLVDSNFPLDSVARKTVVGRPLYMNNLSAAKATAAILSVFPLDTFVDDFAARMEIVGAPDDIPAVQVEVQDAINAAEGAPRKMASVERFAFYDLAASAYAVIQTGERRFYGCFMLRKGVIGPDA